MLKLLIPQHLYQLGSIFGLVKHFYHLNLILRTIHTAPQPVLCLTPPGTYRYNKTFTKQTKLTNCKQTRQMHWLVSSRVNRKTFSEQASHVCAEWVSGTLLTWRFWCNAAGYSFGASSMGCQVESVTHPPTFSMGKTHSVSGAGRRAGVGRTGVNFLEHGKAMTAVMYSYYLIIKLLLSE